MAASVSRSTRPCPAPASAARWPPTPAVPTGSPPGTARDLLIGITVVRADGVVAKAGGRVVKNVAGYDLGKLMIGSFGHARRGHRGGLPAAPAARGDPLGEHVRDRPGAGAGGRPVRPARAGGPAAIEVEWPAQGQGAVHVLLEGREDGVEGRSATVRDLLGERGGELSEDPSGGATYPWDTRATGDDRATALKLTFALSGLADVLTAARESGLHVRGSAGAGVAYAAFAPGTPVDDGSPAVDRIRETCTPCRRQRRRRRRSRLGQGGRRRLGTGARARPDAPRQGPVRSRPPTGARSLRRRHLVTSTSENDTDGTLGEMGSIVDLGLPAAGGAFDEHHPPDAALIGDCVHCGFCLPTCPTYVLWGEEMDSPRGRIYLMKEGLEGEPMSDSMVSHWDACLGCMACVTACPSGVQYDRLIEQTRAQVERSHERSAKDKALRGLIFSLFPHPKRLRLARGPLRLLQKTGLDRALRRTGLLDKLAPQLAAMERLAPRLGKPEPLPRVHPGGGGAPRRRRAADRLRAGSVLPGRQRRHRAGAAGRGLRRRRTPHAGLLRRAVGAQRPRARGPGLSRASWSTRSRAPAWSTSW